MSIFSFKTGANLKIMTLPLIVIAGVLAILLLFVPEGVSRISVKIKDYRSVQEEENVLKEKLDALKNISADSLDSGNISVVALPNKNPGMIVVSQIRKVAEDNKVKVLKISMRGDGSGKNINSSEIDFEAEAESYDSLLKFVKDISKILPLTTLKSVSFERKGKEANIFQGDIETLFYWSDFLATLPPIDKPLDKLTGEDVDLLQIVSGYTRPSYSELKALEPRERPQPFN